MAKLERAVRAADYNTEQRGATLPNGVYEIEVEATEVKKSSKGGSYINVTYEIFLPEQFKGRKMFEIINTYVPTSAKATEIGEERLAMLIKACGIPDDVEVDDTDDLHAKPFLARVGLEKPDGSDNPPKNKIFRFYYPEDEQPLPGVEEPKKERERVRGTANLEPEQERSREHERPAGREREPERGRDRGERQERSREPGPRDDDDGDRASLEQAANEGSERVERSARGGDGSANPWAGRERGARR